MGLVPMTDHDPDANSINTGPNLAGRKCHSGITQTLFLNRDGSLHCPVTRFKDTPFGLYNPGNPGST